VSAAESISNYFPTIPFKTQVLHVHPRIAPDGKTVVYTSDRTGYGQLYEVEIGDVDELPVLEG